MNWIGWQIDYLLLLQNFRNVSGHVFDNFFLTITMFGEIIIPIIFISAIYWSVNKKTGIYILWNYLFGFLSNMFLKTTACIYRPWLLDSRVHPLPQAIPAATGYSFPSGHTAGAVSVWGGAAVSFWNNKFIRYICIALILLIMFSRNYVGVHTPQDVIVSAILGIFILFATKKLLKWEKNGKNRDLIIISAISIINILLLLYINLKSYPMSCFGSKLIFDPTTVKINSFGRIGCSFGIFYGWFLEKRFINFSPEVGTILKKIFRFLIGIFVLFILITYVKPLFTNILGLRIGLFVDYFIIGLFITFIYPYFIKKLS